MTKKVLKGYMERSNLDNILEIYKDWKSVRSTTILSKRKSDWLNPVSVRITIEAIK